MEIILISGPMESGKTYNLNLELRKRAKEGKNVVCFDSYINTRDSARDIRNVAKTAEVFPVKVLDTRTLSEFDRITCEADVIGFDEVQLYSRDEHSRKIFLKALGKCFSRNSRGIEIIASGLNGDSVQRPFSTMSFMFSIATKIVSLKSRRKCYACGGSDNVNFSVKIGAPAPYEQVNVGADYAVCCTKCWSGKVPPIPR